MTADDERAAEQAREELRRDPQLRRAVANLLDHMRDNFDRVDAREPHVLLITDPTTGSRHVTGPWPNRISARIAAILHQADCVRVDPELGNLVYEPLVFMETEIKVDPEKLREVPEE